MLTYVRFPRNGQQAAQFHQWINLGESAASFLYSYNPLFKAYSFPKCKNKGPIFFFTSYQEQHFNMYSVVCTLFLTYNTAMASFDFNLHLSIK